MPPISGFKGVLGVKSRFAGCDPEREVSHAQQPLEQDGAVG
jgi:hypothetical protein